MELVKKAEKTLEGLFKDLPKLPNDAREVLAKLAPWAALIVGIWQLLSAYWVWRLSRVVDVVTDFYNEFGIDVGRYGLSAADKTVIYLAAIVLLVDAVIMLVAFPRLQKRARSGWDLLFLAGLVNVVFAFVSAFVDGRGVGTLIFSLIGSAIGFYILFQIKEKFGGKDKATHVASTTDKKDEQ